MKRYSVAGGGIAGMMTAWHLHQLNSLEKIYISAESKPASLVAAGLINPITGIRFVKSWMADALFPYAFDCYREIERKLNAHFFKPVNIFRIAETVYQLNDWSARSASEDYKPYVSEESDYRTLQIKLHTGKGGFYIKGAAKIEVDVFLHSLFDFFQSEGKLVNEKFDAFPDAENMIFCEGMEFSDNPFTQNIKVIPVKGHYLICDIPDLQSESIIHGKVAIIPQSNGLYKVGSTYQRNDLSLTPDQSQVDMLRQLLGETIQIPCKISDVAVGIRPTSPDRRPVIGCVDESRNLFVFNGLGTKGYSLSPYFSAHLCSHILMGKNLMHEVNVNRFP